MTDRLELSNKALWWCSQDWAMGFRQTISREDWQRLTCLKEKEENMAYQTFQTEYLQMPVITRAYTTACVLTTVAVVSSFAFFFFDEETIVVWKSKNEFLYKTISLLSIWLFTATGCHHTFPVVHESRTNLSEVPGKFYLC